MSARRVAVGGLFVECNHLGGKPTDLACFERVELIRGPALLGTDSGTLGGMLQVLRERGVEPAPLMLASACSGGPLTPDCYAALKDDLVERLRSILPIDGLLLVLHGSG